MPNCFGDNTAKRYRCTSGCDFDLCESCLNATETDKTSTQKRILGGKAVYDDDLFITEDIPDDTVRGADDDCVMSDVSTHLEPLLYQSVHSSFAAFDVSHFAESTQKPYF